MIKVNGMAKVTLCINRFCINLTKLYQRVKDNKIVYNWLFWYTLVSFRTRWNSFRARLYTFLSSLARWYRFVSFMVDTKPVDIKLYHLSLVNTNLYHWKFFLYKFNRSCIILYQPRSLIKLFKSGPPP
jgi:hypothetical protein